MSDARPRIGPFAPHEVTLAAPDRAFARHRHRHAPCARKLVLALGLSTACGCSAAPDPGDWVSVREVSPAFLAAMSSSSPSIAADAYGRVALSFVTDDSSGSDLWLSVSRDSGATFTEPVRINEDAGRVQSSPHGRPMVALGPGASVAVAWMERRVRERPPRLMVRASRDGGLSLAAPSRVAMASAATRTLSGSSIAFLDDGSLFATWVEGPQARNQAADSAASPGLGPAPSRIAFADGPGIASASQAVLHGALSPDGGRRWSLHTRISDSACPCAPAVLGGPHGWVAVAFQRAHGMYRSPALWASNDGGRTFALDTLFSNERLRLDTCPHWGMALAWTDARGGWVAWASGASGRGVHVAPWKLERRAERGGWHITEDLAIARHPQLSQLGDATMIAAEARTSAAEGRSVLAVRVLHRDGSLSPWCFLGADAEAGWIAGISPRTGIACWTEREGENQRARVVTLRRRTSS